MASQRIRVEFHDELITEYFKSLGLQRCWILLNSEIKTISDVAKFLFDNYEVSVPSSHDLLLSMDDFVLPPSESIRILNDKDIVRVKKTQGFLMKELGLDINASSLDGSETFGKQSVPPGGDLLALENVREKAECYQSEPEGSKSDAGDVVRGETTSSKKTISKKRKSSKKLEREKKRIKCSSPERNQKVPGVHIENNGHKERKEGSQGREVSQKTSHKKNKSSKKISKSKKGSSEQVDDTVKMVAKTMTEENCDDQLQENGAKNQEVSPVSDGMGKTPSRNAQRKHAKRKWLQELTSSLKKEMIQKQVSEKHVAENCSEPLHTDERTDKEPNDLVPVVVRPGHIRFESLDEDYVICESQDPVRSVQWNGTTSKKKGQNWGVNSTPEARRNNYKNSREKTVEKLPIMGKCSHSSIYVEKLELLHGLPKEGDVVAYRVVELSSSWTPELSPFRVGKVSTFDSVSSRVVLVPVPGYRMLYKNEESTEKLEVHESLYRNDGSLEIDFAALVGVRILKNDSSTTIAPVGSHEAAIITKEAVSGSGLDNGNGDSNAQVLENGGQSNVWETLSEAVTKQQQQLLLQKDGWNKKQSPGSGSWSFRALGRNRQR